MTFEILSFERLYSHRPLITDSDKICTALPNNLNRTVSISQLIMPSYFFPTYM